MEDDVHQEHSDEDYVIAVAEDIDNKDYVDNTENTSDEDEIEKLIIDIFAYDSFDDYAEPTARFENLQAASFSGAYQRDYPSKRDAKERAYHIHDVFQMYHLVTFPNQYYFVWNHL